MSARTNEPQTSYHHLFKSRSLEGVPEDTLLRSWAPGVPIINLEGGGLCPPHPPGDGASGAIAGALGLFYPRKSQKEGQKDQGEVKELGRTSPSCFKVPWSSWPSFWLFSGLPGTPSRDLLLRR